MILQIYRARTKAKCVGDDYDIVVEYSHAVFSTILVSLRESRELFRLDTHDQNKVPIFIDRIKNTNDLRGCAWRELMNSLTVSVFEQLLDE